MLALPPLFHESESALEDPEILIETLRLGSLLVTHPMFPHSSGDAWIWERLLEQSAGLLWTEPAAVLPWAAIAARCAERSELSAAMLRCDDVKRVLVSLTDGAANSSSANSTGPSLSDPAFGDADRPLGEYEIGALPSGEGVEREESRSGGGWLSRSLLSQACCEESPLRLSASPPLWPST